MSARETIEAAWDARATLTPANAPRELRAAVEQAIAGLDAGRLRVAEKAGGQWITHQWLKKAVLLSFRLEDNRHYFPPYDAAPVARAAMLLRYPAVRRALEALGGQISADDMQSMNDAVDARHQDPAEVVRRFLSTR